MLPPKATIAQLAAYLGVSERTARERAQAVGVYCKPGKPKGFVLAEDVPVILEDSKCRTSSTNAVASGTSQSPLPDGDYAALREQRTRDLQNASRRRPRQRNGDVISMVRGKA